MRKLHFTRSVPILLLQIALLGIGLSGTGFAEGVGSLAESTNDSEAVTNHRILPKEVRLSNLDAFEAQLRKDLPPGTAKTEVESYLGRSELKYAYVSPHHGFSTGIDNIGLRGPFQASLAIWIYLDANDKVKEITFRVQYL